MLQSLKTGVRVFYWNSRLWGEKLTSNMGMVRHKGRGKFQPDYYTQYVHTNLILRSTLLLREGFTDYNVFSDTIKGCRIAYWRFGIILATSQTFRPRKRKKCFMKSLVSLRNSPRSSWRTMAKAGSGFRKNNTRRCKKKPSFCNCPSILGWVAFCKPAWSRQNISYMILLINYVGIPRRIHLSLRQAIWNHISSMLNAQRV